MKLESDTCYSALVSRDARFDGKFFVGVATTGIYCRPVCRVKTPKQVNTRFFQSAAAAEKAGFRPCLRCRPELAPGYAPLDSGSTLACAAKEFIDKGFLHDKSTEDLANRLGISSRYLRRIFIATYGVNPRDYNQSRRFLLARQLLTDTHLKISDIAMAAGFKSQRRFNSSFKSAYRQSPGELRRRGKDNSTNTLVMELGYRAPFAWREFLNFLRPRQIADMEEVTEDGYRRTLGWNDLDGNPLLGWIDIRHLEDKQRFSIQVSLSLLPQISWIRNRLSHFLDLSHNPAEIETRIGDQENVTAGLRIPGCLDSFEAGVRAILGQQISVTTAIRKVHAFVERFGQPVETPYESLSRAFPKPGLIAQTAIEDIASLGIIRQRAGAIILLAEMCHQDSSFLEPGLDVESQMNQLRSIPGIGDWTAHYIALRGLGWTDAFPAADVGVLKALSHIENRPIKAAEARELAQSWRPWRAYKTIHLWQQLAVPPPSTTED